MTSLTCNVTNCINNKNDCCARPEIKVDGASAHNKIDTCCRSFSDRGTSFTSSIDSSAAVKATEIRCDAQDCVHNTDCACGADCVCVDGDGACSCGQTICSTFAPR
ncbi:MAG: DUF1540 domain-containing protein [Clostridia bacterium]|nr:DUF1540 domain-containing protein [Clostridia bacterium]